MADIVLSSELDTLHGSALRAMAAVMLGAVVDMEVTIWGNRLSPIMWDSKDSALRDDKAFWKEKRKYFGATNSQAQAKT